MVEKIVVVGSTNIDRVTRVPRFARPGETLPIGEPMVSVMGGKGLNQAVASARSGVRTIMVTKVGAGFDLGRNMSVSNLQTDHVISSNTAETGQAYIQVSAETGENMIYIYGGANQELGSTDVVQHADAIKTADVVMAQLEIPLTAVLAAFEIAHQAGVTTILNPAPAPHDDQLPDELLALTDILVPNRPESHLLTGIEVSDLDSLTQSADYFFRKGVKAVVITLGSQGAFYMQAGGQPVELPAFKVAAVDTTAAGDTFIGGMASYWDGNFKNLEPAIRYGMAASAISVTRPGAQPSIPTQKEVQAFLANQQA
ncbi:ribokinase [Leuconostocaceae bacterium ESL0723]|nr:ribokinase [Leuconostocaceae bacterium ESL0723]